MNKTNSIGPGKTQMSTTVPEWLDEEIKKLAAESGISRNKYVLAILEEAARRNIKIKTQTLTELTSDSNKKDLKVAEKPANYDTK